MSQKIIFWGTSDFAIPSLKALIKKKYKVLAVIAQPDTKAGRGYSDTMPPIKKIATTNKLKILQPEKVTDEIFIKKIKKLKPDLNIVCAYGKILPEEIINIPKYKTINIHPSLLPKHRGASPIQTTILNGDKQAGITLMMMDAEMDHGMIIKNQKIKVKNYEAVTYPELSEQLSKKSADLLVKILPDFFEKKITHKEQNHDKATFTKLFTKEDGKIYWNKTTDEIDRQIRALNPWPGTFCFWHNHEKETTLRLKILKAVLPYMSSADVIQPKNEGEIFKTQSGLMAIKTLDDYLVIKTIQPEGKKLMSGKDFLNGYPDAFGATLS